MSSATRRGLVTWLDEHTDLSAVLRDLSAHKPDIVVVLHHAHPAAAAVARSAAVELECVATSIDLPPDADDVDLALAETGHQIRVGHTVEYLTTQVRALRPGDLPMGTGDVCLVTGGVDGITARCAAELAKRTGCHLVLLGRSAADSPRVVAGLAALDPSVKKTYLRCDVGDPGQVRAAVAASRTLGPVRGLLHGAGINEPRLLRDVTAATLTATISPKVAGLRALLDQIGPELAMAVGFGSIIGRRGLAGQSEYCLANELLRVELETWAARFPACRTRLLEWSVWAGAGMGERMGVLDALRDQGIVPIDPADGAQALVSVVADPDAPTTLLVTGRFPAGPTLTATGPGYDALRFSADVVVRTPGVEAVLEPVVSTGNDLYLEDHRLDGVPVMPAVAGLEAMAQAAAAAVGEWDGWEFTDISLTAPVVVDEQETRTVRVAALAGESGVEVVLRDEVDGFATDRFSATVRPASPPPAGGLAVSGPPLSTPHPLYGPLLFHSGRMRRLAGYRYLSAFRVEAWIEASEDPWFSEFHSSRLLLGDLGAHDATIHVLLACLPHRMALPIGAERLTVWRQPRGVLLVSAEEITHSGDEYVFDVRLTESSGAVVAQWEGLRLRAIRSREWPSAMPPELIGPLLSRRMIECGHTGKVDLVSTKDGLTAASGARVGLAWDIGEQVTEAVDESDMDAYDRLAKAIEQKADEPGPVSAARVRCARLALRDLGLADQQPLVIEEITNDGLVVIGAATARVTTFAGVYVAAVALRRER